MEEYTKRIRTHKEPQEKRQDNPFEKYGENLRNQLEQISKMISRTKLKKQSSDRPHAQLNTSRKIQNQKPLHSNFHSSIKSEDSVHSDTKDPEKQTRRNLIYDTQSFKDQPQSGVENLTNNNDIFAKILQTKSGYSETMSTASSHSNKMKQQQCKTTIEIGDFAIGKKLGSGKFGEVFVARHKRSGFICALKKISKGNMQPKLLVQLVRQIKIQSFLNHPNIVKLYTFFADQKYIYLVQQLCSSGQLYSLLKKKRKLTEEMTKIIVQQICRALDYMHECQIIHRDLKPQNIIYHNGLIKICDFGWSISSKTMRQTFCGTPLYVSPELLKRKNYNNKIDVWSVGILTYELIFGRVPFEIVNEKDFIKIIEDDIKFTKAMNISEQAKEFIQICLKKDPRDRYTVPQLLEHAFIAIIQNPTLAQLS